jgi:hypothetical protein
VLFSKQPQTHVHVIILCLCVGSCLASALWPRPEPASRPEEDAAVLVRGVLSHALQGPPEPPKQP